MRITTTRTIAWTPGERKMSLKARISLLVIVVLSFLVQGSEVFAQGIYVSGVGPVNRSTKMLLLDTCIL